MIGSYSMPPRAKKSLEDILQAGAAIGRFVAGRTWDEYESGEMLRSAVERQFTIIGEALNRLKKDAPAIQVTDSRAIVAFRNVLVHGYDVVEDALVWKAIETDLPSLMREVASFLAADE